MNKIKKSDLFFISIFSAIFLWGAFSMAYKKVTFDPSEKTNVKENNVIRIYNGNGHWKWNNKEYDFYNDYLFSLTKNQITEFCKILNSSKITDTVVIKPKEWLYIYIKEKNIDKIIVLQKNKDGEVYFEFEDSMFEGKELEKYIYKHIEKTKKDRTKKLNETSS